MITASIVKELRDKTNAGMKDCKKVLTETNGDIEASIKLLRERGIMKAGKKSDRAATEGIITARVNGAEVALPRVERRGVRRDAVGEVRALRRRCVLVGGDDDALRRLGGGTQGETSPAACRPRPGTFLPGHKRPRPRPLR